jgi:3-isopropylmalate/(R)-2-methylmalate dehydratase large subunit
MERLRTFFDKVWTEHVIADLGDDVSLLHVDRLFLHEISGSVAMRRLEASGRSPAAPQLVFTVIDHLVDTRPGRGLEDAATAEGADMIRSARRASLRYGFTFFDVPDPRQGIVHVISPELGVALPGLTLVCGDSHTCTVGGVGALAWGIGSTEGEQVLATQTLPQAKPRTMRVVFEGRPPAHVSPKDLILHLIGAVGADAGIGYAVEFAGPAIRAMPIEGRLTVCNMAVEFSAKYGFVAPDDVTLEYLAGRPFAPRGRAWERAVAYWRTLPTDPGAAFDREISIDATAVQPQVTWGTSPQQVAAVDGRVPDPAAVGDPAARGLAERALAYMRLTPGTPLGSIPIDAAYIGSCTNARLSDLRAAAAVLQGRKVAPGVQALCIPGSTAVKRAAEAEGLDRVFREAGFEWHESGCGFCAHLGNDRLEDLRVVSTTNRNFEGRQGRRTRTHLASPATVAASAIAGRLADVRRLPG